MDTNAEEVKSVAVSNPHGFVRISVDFKFLSGDTKRLLLPHDRESPRRPARKSSPLRNPTQLHPFPIHSPKQTNWLLKGQLDLTGVKDEHQLFEEAVKVWHRIPQIPPARSTTWSISFLSGFREWRD
jgi:hypothetical protein